MREITLADESATGRLGSLIASGLQPGDIVALEGDLGAGKTTLARAILAGLGICEAVPSPTFTLVQHYESESLPIGHFDLYRIEDEAELDELGLEDSLAAGAAAIVEWPERAGQRFAENALRIRLKIVGDHARDALVSGPLRWAPVFEGTTV